MAARLGELPPPHVVVAAVASNRRHRLYPLPVYVSGGSWSLEPGPGSERVDAYALRAGWSSWLVLYCKGDDCVVDAVEYRPQPAPLDPARAVEGVLERLGTGDELTPHEVQGLARLFSASTVDVLEVARESRAARLVADRPVAVIGDSVYALSRRPPYVVWAGSGREAVSAARRLGFPIPQGEAASAIARHLSREGLTGLAYWSAGAAACGRAGCVGVGLRPRHARLVAARMQWRADLESWECEGYEGPRDALVFYRGRYAVGVWEGAGLRLSGWERLEGVAGPPSPAAVWDGGCGPVAVSGGKAIPVREAER